MDFKLQLGSKGGGKSFLRADLSAGCNGPEKSPAAKMRLLEDKRQKRRIREYRVQQQDNAQIEQFLDVLWLERNLAENTLVSYRL